eukprot:jgi/Mesen1/4622/ME000237S03660
MGLVILLVCVLPFAVMLTQSKREKGKSGRGASKVTFFGRPAFCEGKWIYAYDLPPQFNDELVESSGELASRGSPAPQLGHMGLGGRSDYGFTRNGRATGVPSGWYDTWQFSLEVYFYERMKRYPCRTDNPEEATAFYIPFFAGLDLMLRRQHQHQRQPRPQRLRQRQPRGSRQEGEGEGEGDGEGTSAPPDGTYARLLEELQRQPYLERNGGRDHF